MMQGNKWHIVLAVVMLWPMVMRALAGESEQESSSDTPGASMTEREKAFKDTMTNVVLKGTWQMKTEKGHPSGETPLTKPQPDQYTITETTKLHGDYWMFQARVQYAAKDVTIPVTARVVWAGDTPIITLNKLAMPLLGTYSARVMVYGGYYSGTWFGDCYGGILSGEVFKADAKSAKSNDAPMDESDD